MNPVEVQVSSSFQVSYWSKIVNWPTIPCEPLSSFHIPRHTMSELLIWWLDRELTFMVRYEDMLKTYRIG